MTYEVKIEVFEGPFGLLLQLITKQELDIHKVPIAQITDSYLEHLNRMTELDLEVATEFLLISATLMLLKTHSLLPKPPVSEFEEEASPESIREDLVSQLMEYKKFANAASFLGELYNSESKFYRTLREVEEDFSYAYPDTFEGVSVEGLTQALVTVLLAGAETRVDVSHITPIDVSLEDYISKTRNLLKRKGKVRFSDMISGCSRKIEIIVTFLALLELYKKSEISLAQRNIFGDIIVAIAGTGKKAAGAKKGAK